MYSSVTPSLKIHDLLLVLQLVEAVCVLCFKYVIGIGGKEIENVLKLLLVHSSVL